MQAVDNNPVSPARGGAKPRQASFNDVLRIGGAGDIIIFRRNTLEGINLYLEQAIPQMVFVVGGYRFGKSTIHKQLERFPIFAGRYLVHTVSCDEIDEDESDPLRWLGEKTIAALRSLVFAYQPFCTDEPRELLEEQVKAIQDKVNDPALLGDIDVPQLSRAKHGLLQLIDTPANLQNEIFVKRVFTSAREALNELETHTGSPGSNDQFVTPPELLQALTDGETLANQLADVRSRFASFERELPLGHSPSFTRAELGDLAATLDDLPLNDNKRLVLVFDDLDVLVERADLRDSELIALLEVLSRTLLNGPLRIVVTMSQTPSAVFTEKRLGPRHDRITLLLERTPSITLVPLHEEYWTHPEYAGRPTTVRRDYDAVERLVEAIPKAFDLPSYAGREFLKITGGQPFLLEQLLIAAQEVLSGRDGEGGELPPDWIAIIDKFEKRLTKGELDGKSYCDYLVLKMPASARELLAIAGSAPPAPSVINYLPAEIHYKQPRHLGIGSTNSNRKTEAVMDDVIEAPNTHHTLFRRATNAELETRAPYVIRVEDATPGKAYVAVSRYLLASLSKSEYVKGPSRGSTGPWIDRLPRLDLYQLIFFFMVVLAFFWFLYSFMDVDPLWALPAALLPVAYSAARGGVESVSNYELRVPNWLLDVSFILFMLGVVVASFLPLWCLVLGLGCQYCCNQ